MMNYNRKRLIDANLEAFKQIYNREDNQVSKSTIENLSADSSLILEWQCNNNANHIWATQVYNRGDIETDLGCPYCLNLEKYNEGTVLLQHQLKSNRQRDYVQSIWYCNRCLSVWEYRDLDTINYKSICINCEIGLKIETLHSRYPELAKEWDDDNLLSSEQVNIEYANYINWKCSTCNQVWSSTLTERVKNLSQCPFCSGKLPIPVKTSFAALYPEYLSEWNWEANPGNGRDPYKLFPNNKFNVDWICNICEFPYSTSIVNRLSADNCCPNCQSNNPIAKEQQEILKRELNNITDSIYLYPNCKTIITWLCSDCSNLWISSVYDRLYNQNFCPYCSGKKAIAGKTSFKAIYPNKAIELTENNTIDLDEVLPSYMQILAWRCLNCNLEWKATPKDRSEGVADCPYCSGKKAIPGKTSFKALCPNMAIELIDNAETNLDEVLPSYTPILSWKCLDCNLEWKASPKDRSEGVANCPYCSGKKAIPGKTSFKALYPNMAIELIDNVEINLDEVLPSYTLILSWKCLDCNLEWKASPRDRSEGVSDCPYCSGKKATPGKTSFKAQNPSLMNEWKDVNNLFIDADLILENYSQNVWWICSKCKSSYEMSPKAKLIYYKRRQESCSYCKGYRKNKIHFF